MVELRAMDPSGRIEDYVLVDLIDESRLTAIVGAMRDILRRDAERVWPGPFSRSTITTLGGRSRVVLVPLERLGATQGFGGGTVMISYFLDSHREYLPSRPLVVKIGNHRQLRRELDGVRHWPPHYDGEDSRFARPTRLYRHPDVKDVAVLLAPFASSRAVDEVHASWQLGVRDLWRLLHDDSVVEGTSLTAAQLGDLYKLLHDLHRAGKLRCDREQFVYGDQYDWYLRDLEEEDAELPKCLFGQASSVKMLGRRWHNPNKTLQRVLPLSFEGASGPAHGDLHPKNVVLDSTGHAHVIDFGWFKRESAHVLRDYLLMDVNLRAVTLPSRIDLDEVASLCRVLTPDQATRISDPAANYRLELIREGLWQPIRRYGLAESWEWEYIVPLFLVSFGLLKHFDAVRNQLALLLLILTLSDQVAGLIES